MEKYFFYHKISAKTYAPHVISQYIKTFQKSYQRAICSFSHLRDKHDPPDKHPFQHSLVTAESHQKKKRPLFLKMLDKRESVKRRPPNENLCTPNIASFP